MKRADAQAELDRMFAVEALAGTTVRWPSMIEVIFSRELKRYSLLVCGPYLSPRRRRDPPRRLCQLSPVLRIWESGVQVTRQRRVQLTRQRSRTERWEYREHFSATNTHDAAMMLWRETKGKPEVRLRVLRRLQAVNEWLEARAPR